MDNQEKINLPMSEMLFYTNSDGKLKVEVFYSDENFWLNQKKMAELFGVDVRTISEHLQNIFHSEELVEEATIRKFRIVQTEGKREVEREIDFYHLDAIIAVGYRVNSKQATQFRIWATKTLKEFLIKGFVLDDERLKQGPRFGKDYFDELIVRIREIRASERRFYQKVTDIYEQCSIDYQKNAEVTREFFKTVQNKLHWAITGKTAAELINERANSRLPNMGLQTWKNAPVGKILKSDVVVAKNYLNQPELEALNRVVVMYLDYAENQAQRQIQMRMKDWAEKLDAFIQFNEYDLLRNSGKVSHDVAKSLAEKEYEVFRIEQDKRFESDFDREVKKITMNIDEEKSK